MKKIAIFVEGQTEQIFLEKLLVEVAGRNSIVIDSYRASGGSSAANPRKLHIIQASKKTGSEKYYALVVDCGADNRVSSDVRDQYESLAADNYSAILGVRDVYPDFTRADIPKLRLGLKYRVKTKPIDPVFVLGVMEIESWFLAESTHFERIDAALTPDAILAALGFDPRVEDMQLRAEAAGDLHRAYALVGKAYTKRRAEVSDTVNAIDYESMYLNLPGKFPDLATLVGVLDGFFSS